MKQCLRQTQKLITTMQYGNFSIVGFYVLHRKLWRRKDTLELGEREGKKGYGENKYAPNTVEMDLHGHR